LGADIGTLKVKNFLAKILANEDKEKTRNLREFEQILAPFCQDLPRFANRFGV